MDVGEVLLDILIVLVAAKIAAEIAERLKIPAVVGEIVAGIIIGPSVLTMVDSNQTLAVLGELGVILLLLGVGMEMNLTELGAVGRSALSVACIGVIVPMVGGFGVAETFGESTNTAIFLGAALAATSVGITARVFSDLRALATVEARTVLGAAVADDVLGLVILTVVVRLVSEGSVSIADVAVILLVAIGFLIVTTIVGSKTAPTLFHFLDRHARSAGTLVAIALAFTLAFAELADAAKLAPIVGAFVAGLALSGSSASERIQRELSPVGHLLIPVFFLEIGISVRVEEFANPEVLGIAGALLVVAVVGKLVAAAGAIGAPGDKRLIGLGMLPRGEVGLIFATIGLKEGVLGDNLYAALLLVVLATTLMAPPLLRWRLQQVQSQRSRRVDTTVVKPEAGWLVVDDGAIELAAEPPPRLALDVTLEAALAIAHSARPGTKLLDWIGYWNDEPLRWEPSATKVLFQVLREGNSRSWRFLETTGVLERALPELADAVQRRRADPFVLDPTQVLRFDLVERLHEVTQSESAAASQHAALEHPEWLMLAALILDTAGEDSTPVEVARRLVKRLDLGATAEEEIALLVGETGLLRAAAHKVDGLDEERVYPIATHLATPERARALYLLTLALGDITPWDRERLDNLLELILKLLEQPDLTGRDARNLVESRRAEAMRHANGQRGVADRIEHAPRAYLLSQDARDIARQAALLEPLPSRGQVRVSLLPVDPSEWRVEVASRDRPGLLATITGVLADKGLDILDAVVATWRDGGAVDVFLVRRAELNPARLTAEELSLVPAPDSATLEAAIVEAFDLTRVVVPNPDAEIAFDDDASPWYTLCEIRSPDRRGLLHSLAAGMTSAGADVHSARLVTVSGIAVDRFELTDRNGRKLTDDGKDAVVTAVRDGVTAKRRRLGRR